MVREGNLQIDWNISFNYSFRNVQGIGFICMIAYNCYIFFFVGEFIDLSVQESL